MKPPFVRSITNLYELGSTDGNAVRSHLVLLAALSIDYGKRMAVKSTDDIDCVQTLSSQSAAERSKGNQNTIPIRFQTIPLRFLCISFRVRRALLLPGGLSYKSIFFVLGQSRRAAICLILRNFGIGAANNILYILVIRRPPSLRFAVWYRVQSGSRQCCEGFGWTRRA